MANPENPNDEAAKVPVAELQQNAAKATPIYFTLLIYISVLILGVLVAIALINNPNDRADESGPAPAETDKPVKASDNGAPVTMKSHILVLKNEHVS